jgi:PhoPQ-activated pathogenicity-related protein
MTMRKTAILVSLFVCMIGFQYAWPEPFLPGLERTALDRYIATPDPSYSYTLVNTIKQDGITVYALDMISQTWRSEDEVDRTQWQHWVTIMVPDTLETQTGLLFIGGGSNGKSKPSVDKTMAKIALATRSVVTSLSMVPNQPLHFLDEAYEAYKEKGRYEDDLIAYTWDKYLKTGDPLWAARLPMVKSAVRAMDTVTLFLGSDEGGKKTVDQYVVAGGSKRGWTTWMTAAVDARVIGMVPIVIDLLNLEESFKHHWKVYGFWAPAIGDYVEMNLMEELGTPAFHNLMKLVEPYEYRARFTMPKFMLNASGDQFFCPDSAQFYYDDLPGEKHIRYVPNGDHGLDDTDAVESLSAFYHAMAYNKSLPEYRWEILKDGTIRVETQTKPVAVKLWQATNPTARDFRLETIGKAWTSTDLEAKGDGIYQAKPKTPETGWTAYFIEMTYPSSIEKIPFKFTSAVKVLPDRYPFRYPPEK